MLGDMLQIFEKANARLLQCDVGIIESGVNERSICGALMCHLREQLGNTRYASYHVDVEYNRNCGSLKTIVNGNYEIVPICCDLIVHSRADKLDQDNLIALEMARSTHAKGKRESDKVRLQCLTSDSFDNIWQHDGSSLPEHVCRYVLGVYYEIDTKRRQVSVEYFVKGAPYGEPREFSF